AIAYGDLDGHVQVQQKVRRQFGLQALGETTRFLQFTRATQEGLADDIQGIADQFLDAGIPVDALAYGVRQEAAQHALARRQGQGTIEEGLQRLVGLEFGIAECGVEQRGYMAVVTVHAQLEESVLVAEGVVQGTPVDPGGIQQLLDGTGLEAFLPELLHGDLENHVIIKLYWTAHK